MTCEATDMVTLTATAGVEFEHKLLSAINIHV